jgi:hypothetical protein
MKALSQKLTTGSDQDRVPPLWKWIAWVWPYVLIAIAVMGLIYQFWRARL